MEGNLRIFLLKCFYLMLPGYFANMAPVIAKKINFLATPIDFRFKFNNKPLFGAHKTFRGFVFGIAFAVVVSYLQSMLYNYEFFSSISIYNYINWLLFGVLMGLGALSGDLLKSFIKRRVNIKPGDKFVPFDQIDFVVGSLIFVMPIMELSMKVFFASITLSFLLHIAVNHAAYYLKIRNEKW